LSGAAFGASSGRSRNGPSNCSAVNPRMASYRGPGEVSPKWSGPESEAVVANPVLPAAKGKARIFVRFP
jgi:hypothetical protein